MKTYLLAKKTSNKKIQFPERDILVLQEALRNYSGIMLSLHFSAKENPTYFQFKHYF